MKDVRGFTLAELSVALVIIALLVGGLLSPLTAQHDIEARRNTAHSLENIREALLGYAIQHGRLPCPANANIATGNTGAGMEASLNSSGNCSCTSTTLAASGGIAGNDGACNGNTVSGVLPWATLGLDELDAWGNRYSYLVTTYYARSAGNQASFDCDTTAPDTPPNNAAFALCSKGLALIRTSSSANWSPLTTSNEVPAVVVSHGNNGLGARLSTGNIRAGATGDELFNADGDAIFVSNTNIDDQIVWISRPLLMSRMITAGRLP